MFNKKTFSIRFHGYGGQGVKSLAFVLGKAAIYEGLYAQAFPEFGPERRGAPVLAYARFSCEPIKIKTSIEKPDFVVVLSENLLDTLKAKEGITAKTQFLVNTKEDGRELKKKYSLATDYRLIHCLNVDEKVQEYERGIHPSIPVLSALLKITEMVPIERIKQVLREEYLEKIGEKKTEITQKALEKFYYEIG